MKVFFRSRKGQFLTTQQFFFAFKRLFYIMIGIVIVLYAAKTSFSSEHRIVEDLQHRLLLEQLLNNPSCFAYRERPYSQSLLRVLDAQKLTIDRFEHCLTSSAPPLKIFPAKLTLVFDDRHDSFSLQTSSWTIGERSDWSWSVPVIVVNDSSSRSALLSFSVRGVVS